MNEDFQVLLSDLPGPEQQAIAELQQALAEHWGLGQYIVLSWAPVIDGVRILKVPHYFLGDYSASHKHNEARRDENDDEGFIRKLISGDRLTTDEVLQTTAKWLDISPILIPLKNQLVSEKGIALAEQLIQRYSIRYAEDRAVLLFDIVDFSLATPFEQTSMLNSLSYSINAAYSKMLKVGTPVNFSRSTTGDGFYIWNQDHSLLTNVNLYQFMLLILADNALAKKKAKGKTVPTLRAGFHIGSYYEFHQAEGLNPTMFSYIVGDVTIELARMLDIAQAGQIFVGDFNTQVPTSRREAAYPVEVDAVRFIDKAEKLWDEMSDLELAGEKVTNIRANLTGEVGSSGGQNIRRFQIVDKHNRTRNVYNLRANIHTKGKNTLILGLHDHQLPKRDPQNFRDSSVTLQAIKRPSSIKETR